MEPAGEPGDRWLGCRKMAEREESPDTVLPERRLPKGGRYGGGNQGDAPGNARGLARRLRRKAELHAQRAASRLSRDAVQWVTDSATENRPPAGRSSVTSSRETCETSSKAARFGKGEKVG